MKTRAKRLMGKMLKAYPYVVVTLETAFRYLEQGGQVDVKHFKEWLEINGYWRTYFNC